MANVGKVWSYRYYVSRNGFRVAEFREPHEMDDKYATLHFTSKEECEESYRGDLKRHARRVVSTLKDLSNVGTLKKRLKDNNLDAHLVILEDVYKVLEKLEQDIKQIK